MTIFEFVGQLSIGLVLAGATIGSSLGIGAVGSAATGAWTKEARQSKTLNFSYIILIGMPLSQTIYGFILVLVGIAPLVTGANPVTVNHAGTLLGIGLAGGLAEFFSAWVQGLIGAGACRTLSESDGKGLVFMVIAMGIVETVGLFGFVFLLLVLP
jgi:V/A-type H+-transporting ATPase subunit K